MSMTAGEGDGGAGMIDDASCNSLAETAAAAAGDRDGTCSLVERCTGDGDCRCGGVRAGWGVDSFELLAPALRTCVTDEARRTLHIKHQSPRRERRGDGFVPHGRNGR